MKEYDGWREYRKWFKANPYYWECKKESPKYAGYVIACIVLAALMLAVAVCGAEEGTASYYTVKSCQREGTSGVWTASGQRYDETKMTCAMWGVPFGTKVRVLNLETGKAVICTVNDRGPAKRLVKSRRIIDLTPAAFRATGASLSYGIIPIDVTVIE